jgi:PPM family protein phosphatase
MALASVNSNEFEIAGAMLTDIGRARTTNEDAVAFVIPSNNDPAASKGSLLLVADGMGGHAAGEVASALAVESVRRVYYSVQDLVPRSLITAFNTANQAIFEHGRKRPECRGMGTTCTALAIRDRQVWLAHVGDSRAYLLRGNALIQLSDDQSLHAQMIREGLLTKEEAKFAGGGNLLLQALGTRENVVPTIWEKGMPLTEGDILILCSDGLWNLVDDATIAQVAARAAPHEACQNLISAALEAGGYDNVSVGVFAVRAPAVSAAELQKRTRPIKIPGPEAADTPKAVSGIMNVTGEIL